VSDEGISSLETERLILEPLSRQHAAHLFPVLSDARIYQFIPQEPPVSVLALEDRYGRLESRVSPSGQELWLNWAIFLKEQNAYLGTVQATVFDYRRSWLAYELSPAFWGHGYATEACAKVIEALFTDYNVAEIGAEVDTRNEASYKLLERLSFRRIKTSERADFFKGKFSDEYTYRLSREEIPISDCGMRISD
jgi:ribosomal-protein-alanine N-acetyltransferase